MCDGNQIVALLGPDLQARVSAASARRRLRRFETWRVRWNSKTTVCRGSISDPHCLQRRAPHRRTGTIREPVAMGVGDEYAPPNTRFSTPAFCATLCGRSQNLMEFMPNSIPPSASSHLRFTRPYMTEACQQSIEGIRARSAQLADLSRRPPVSVFFLSLMAIVVRVALGDVVQGRLGRTAQLHGVLRWLRHARCRFRGRGRTGGRWGRRLLHAWGLSVYRHVLLIGCPPAENKGGGGAFAIPKPPLKWTRAYGRIC